MYKSREVVLITGKTGSGKSVLMKELLLSKDRVIIFDSNLEYIDQDPPFPALLIYNYCDLVDFLIKNQRKPFKIVFVPLQDPKSLIELKTGEKLILFELIGKIIFQTLNNVTFAVEEIANFMNKNSCPLYFDKIVRLGRHNSISIYCTTQRPPDMHPNLKAQCTRFISFKQHLPNDIEWIGDVINDKAQANILRDLETFVWGKPMLKDKHYKEYIL